MPDSVKKQKRIALMLSGQPRAVAETFPFIKRNLLDCNENVDVFIHCWYDPEQAGGAFSETSAEKLGVRPNILVQDAPAILQTLYKPVAISIEPQEDFSDRASSLPNVPHKLVNKFGIFSAWTSRKRCNALVTAYEQQNGFQYDFVISGRTDCLLLRKIKFSSPAFRRDCLHIHGHDVRGSFGIVDQFYFASSNHMRTIATIADNIESYVAETNLWNAEAQLYQHLTRMQIPVCGHRWFPILVRGDGVKKSILKGVLMYTYITLKDFVQEVPILDKVYTWFYNKYKGPKENHAEWVRDKETMLLSRRVMT